MSEVSTHGLDGESSRAARFQDVDVNADGILDLVTRDSWPLSGTIMTHRVSTDGTDQTSVITFNGTRHATLTVGEVTSTVDLARGRVGGAHAGGLGPGGWRRGGTRG